MLGIAIAFILGCGAGFWLALQFIKSAPEALDKAARKVEELKK